MTAGEVAALFTRGEGSYLFARWRRLIVSLVARDASHALRLAARFLLAKMENLGTVKERLIKRFGCADLAA